ncbi:DNA methyltransferase [Longimicrobium sp.]|uniref:DNA methyltransferase n=1 Tax=Longimicrobium sp. TaxID=2029185 RepID=UPI003B3AD561
MSANLLYYGDNLDILRRAVSSETVDLIYLDPPFNSNHEYNLLFKEQDGKRAEAQEQVFGDTWWWDERSALTYEELIENGPLKLGQAMKAFRTFLGESDMMAYLAMMAPRLLELREVLKPTGSIYLHCDTTASHYLKILMDAVFGPQMFRNEIIWKRTNVHNDSKTWSHVTDSLLFYTKTGSFTWNAPYVDHDPKYVEDKYRFKDKNGRRYQLDNMTSPKPRPRMMYEWKGHSSPQNGWRYSRETMERLDREGRIWYPDSKMKRPRLKRYLDEMSGTLLTNVWTDIPPLNSRAAERLGYPTQKPEALLERIIEASSNPGDTVLDPFCGCGTTVAAAEKLRRRWIGIDITIEAINIIRARLEKPTTLLDYEVHGVPTSMAEARALARQDRHQFQWWALDLVGVRDQQKKGADRGIDGRLFFHDEPGKGKTKQIIFSVKSGHVSVRDVRELSDVVRREEAQIGVLITLEPPTKPMRSEAVSAGLYKSPWGYQYPRIQVLTIEDLLNDQRVQYPNRLGGTTKRKPQRKSKIGAAPELLDLGLELDPDTILAEREAAASAKKILRSVPSTRGTSRSRGTSNADVPSIRPPKR